MSSEPGPSTTGSLMAGGELISASHSDDMPENLVQMARQLEQRIRDYVIEDDADYFEPEMTYDDCAADLALVSGDFLMSQFLPDAETTADLPLVVSTEPATVQRHRAVLPKRKPVPRPRLSKMSAARTDSDGTPVRQNGSSSSSSGAVSGHSGTGMPDEPKNANSNAASGSDPAFSHSVSTLGDSSALHYRMQLEFAQKLGFSEAELLQARVTVGPDCDTNKLLSALIQVHDIDQASKIDPDGAVEAVMSEAVMPQPFSTSYREHLETASSSSRRNSSEMLARCVSDDAACATSAADGDDGLRFIVIDGSNVAMSHGSKLVFSCRGIQIVVNWFRQRGHKRITVFVPQWRKETSYPMAPISDQHILDELEQDKVLVYTPSRRLHGRRVVCYDDRYVLQLASSEDAVVVSNDNYRDLVKENPAFKRIVEERLLMYTFVNDRFMPPDDPLGRHGPTLDQFLRRCSVVGKRSSSTGTRNSSQLCPYGRKCTYGAKCKYAHPERSATAAAVAAVAGGGHGGMSRLDAQYSAASAAGRAVGSASAWPVATSSVASSDTMTDSAYATRLAESHSRSPVARSMSSGSAGDQRRRFNGRAAAESAMPPWSQGPGDDDDRTHSLPIDGTSVADVSAAGQQLHHWRPAPIRTDQDVLRECKQRLALVRCSTAGATASVTAAAATSTGAATAAAGSHKAARPYGAAAGQWHRHSAGHDSSSAATAATAVDGRQSSMSSTPAVTATYVWPIQPDNFEDTCISDPGSFHFLPTASYDADGRDCYVGGGLMQSTSMLQRQHSYSDPYLSTGGGVAGDSGSPYSSSGELVARTSWPYGRSQHHEHAAALAGNRSYNAQLLAQCARTDYSGGAPPVGVYQEHLSRMPPWSYYSEGYTSPVLLQSLSIGQPYPAAVLRTPVAPGPVPAGSGYLGGHSRFSPRPADDPSAPFFSHGATGHSTLVPQQQRQPTEDDVSEGGRK